MAVARFQRVIHVECPACHWPKAVLAYENSRTRCFLCPHCQFLWDTTETAHEESARLTRRTTDLHKEHGTLKNRPFDQAEHAEHKTRLQKHLRDLESRRRK